MASNSSYFQVFQSLYESVRDYFKCNYYNQCHHHLQSIFSSITTFKYLSIVSLFFSFSMLSATKAKFTIRQVLFLFFYFWLLLDLVVWSRLGDPFVSSNPSGLCVSHSLGKIPGCAYTNVHMVKSKFIGHFPVDQLPHPVVSSLILILLQFAVLAYYVIDHHFVSIMI